MHGSGLAFQISCTCECDLKDVFFMQLPVADQCCSSWSWCKNITLVYSISAVGKWSILHCLWIRFVMYMDWVCGCIVVRNCQCREERSLSTADSDFSYVQSLLLPPAFFPPSLILFSAFHFLHKGKMRKNKTNIWKLKHDRERGGDGGGWGRVGWRNRGRRGNLRKQEGFQK